METEKIICVFCGGRAVIKKDGNVKIVSCPRCKRQTDFDTYQDVYDKWMGDIRDEE